MAVFDFDKMDDYVQQQSEGFNFFKLEDDGWMAKVRFMYGPGEGIPGFSVHNVSQDPKKPKHINCLREAGQPLEVCPLCNNGNPTKVQFYLTLYVISMTKCINGRLQAEEPVNQVMIFQRGTTFRAVIGSVLRQSQGRPLVNNIFNLVRSGKKGDVSSTYTAELVGNDNTTLDTLPQRPEILGSYILPKVDYNDMLKYVGTNMSTPQDIVPRTVTNNMNNNSYQAPIKPTGIPF